MSIKDAITTRARAYAGLTALIGASPTTRLYNTQAPQNTLMPYVTYQQVSGDRVHVMGRDSLARPRFQFDSWAATRAGAEDLNAQVVACFNRWSGTVAGMVVKDTIIESADVDGQSDDIALLPRVTSEAEITYEL